jgi:hypothetical protein
MQNGGEMMLYVLASDAGWLYYYEPGAKPGDYSIGHDDIIVTEARMWPRPEGALTVVFETAADGFQFIYHFSLPGEEKPSRIFNPRPARAEDNLGPMICLAKPQGKGGDFLFTVLPTPSDAVE